MSMKIKVEISSDVMQDLRRSLKKEHNYKYSGSDNDLAMHFMCSIEAMSGHDLVEVLLGCCSPEELL